MVKPEKNDAEREEIESSNATFRDQYPNLAKLVFITWPWGEAEDIWLEHMTGEPQGKRRGSRDPGL